MLTRSRRWGLGLTLSGVFLIAAGVTADSHLASRLGQLVMFIGILLLLLNPA